MLHSEKVYYLIGLNKYLELAVVEGTNGIYTLPKYTYEQCSKMTNGNFRFVSNNGIEFIYSDNLEKDSFSWIFLGKLIRSSTIETQKHIIKYFIENIFEVVTNPNIIDSLHFVEGLRKNDIVQIRKVPKSDLHNHIPLGGSRDILRDLTGYYVPMLSEKFSSILELTFHIYIAEQRKC